MSERKRDITDQLNQSKVHELPFDGVVNVTNIETLDILGVSPDSVALQVSKMIDMYRSEHGPEMLAKSPEAILSQISAGHSVILMGVNGHEPTVLYHGTVYPNFENGEQVFIGQVVEFGTAITHQDYRGGYGFGTLGARLRLEHTESLWGDQVVALSTNKQALTTRVLGGGAGFVPVDYHDHPYLTYLTCTCSNCSEVHGHQSCGFRRTQAQSAGSQLIQITDKTQVDGHMPCTLVVHSKENAARFEENCRTLDESEPLMPGKPITIERMAQAAAFFNNLKLQNEH